MISDTNMEQEPSIDSLGGAKRCTKYPDHTSSMPFTDFKESDLPTDYQNNEVMKIIEDVGRRVVAVTAVVLTEMGEQTKRGSGIIFKIKKEFYIQTNYHVTRGAADIQVTYTYNKQRRQPEVLKGGRRGVCFNQDKALYILYGAPIELCRDPEIPDLQQLIVTMEPGGKGLLEYYRDDKYYRDDIYAVHFPSIISNRKPAKLKFWNDKRIPCNAATICSKSPESHECCRVLINKCDVPSEIQNLFRKDLPWNQCDHPFAVAISHPHGDAKRISFGKVVDFKAGEMYLPRSGDKPSFHGVVFVRHHAATCPGSSGGCIIILHGTGMDQLGYHSYLCMHHGTTKKEGNIPINSSALGLIN